MVVEDLIYAIPEELVEKFSGLISVLKIVGFAVIAYVIFAIINAILHRKRNKEIKEINNNLNEIKILLSNKSAPQQDFLDGKKD